MTSCAPLRAGSNNNLLNLPFRKFSFNISSNILSFAKSIARNSTLLILLSSAFCFARSTRPCSPSIPRTLAAFRANGKVKLPIPQNRSSTRSLPFTSNSSNARGTIARLISMLTCVKSIGRKFIVRSNSGNE